MRETRRWMAFAAILYAIGCLTGVATAHASPQAYTQRLAHHAAAAEVQSNCLALPTIDLCGYRAPLVARSTHIRATVSDCRRWGPICAFTFHGRTHRTAFFCTGVVAWYPRAHRWIADQALACYGDDDPSWTEYDGGVVIR